MKYTPIHDLWYYSPLSIKNLDNIQKELIQLHLTETNRWKTNAFYTNISSKIAINKCAALTQFLHESGILHKFDRLLFSSHQTTSPFVHVDSLNPVFCQTSLNIPLIDCDGSYTAFYTSDVYPRMSIDEANFGWLYEHECKELCRVEVVQPMLVNTTILHRGITTKPSRLICGIRFNIPLTVEDLVSIGISEPFTQSYPMNDFGCK